MRVLIRQVANKYASYFTNRLFCTPSSSTKVETSPAESSIDSYKFDEFWQRLCNFPALKELAESNFVASLKSKRDNQTKTLQDLKLMLENGSHDDQKEDDELAKIAREDMQRVDQERLRIETQILELMMPRDESVQVERQQGLILAATCGAGGQESMLFTRELFVMYRNFAMFKGWTFDETEMSGTDIGG